MLKAGFARLDITPPLDTYLAGYFKKRYAKEILDFTYLNALAVTDGTETAIIITADVLGIYSSCADRLRALIEEKTGIPANHVMLSALHQHTSVSLSDGSDIYKNDKAYVETLCRKFIDVAQMAIKDMKEASLSRAEKETEEPISFIRRYMMKDGSVVTNPGLNSRDEILHPCGEADNTVRLLRFKREGGNDIALVNFSTHPDVVGGEAISADWPGFVRSYVEEDLEGVSCLFLNGVQGDTNHIDILNGRIGRSYERSKQMGRIIADTVVNVWDKTTPCKNVSVNADITDVYNRTRTDGEERYEECKSILDDYNKGKKYVETVISEAIRIVDMKNETIYRRLPVSVISLGEVAFVGFGGEPFTHYATAIREACPDKYVIAACCTNGFAGYLPTATAFAEGGYEARSSRFTPTLESECVGAAIQTLSNM